MQSVAATRRSEKQDMMMTAASQDAALLPRRMLYITAVKPALVQGRDEVKVIRFAGLTADCLAHFRPDVVLFPLFSIAEDATIILTRLHELGYQGECLVLCPNLPKPRLIEAELRALAPDIRVQVLASDAAAPEAPPQTAGLSRL